MLCSFKTFLLPLLSQPQTEVEEGKTVERVPSPIPSSVLGQPPSALGVEDGGTESLNYDLDLGLQKLWEGHGLEQDFIMNETVDERESSLMDGELRLNFVEVFSKPFVVVPILPQPNEFPKDWHVPRSFCEFVIPVTLTNEKRYPDNLDLPPQQFLKAVKGCQSLGLAMSWVLVYFQFSDPLFRYG
jgi:hypothetical protein